MWWVGGSSCRRWLGTTCTARCPPVLECALQRQEESRFSETTRAAMCNSYRTVICGVENDDVFWPLALVSDPSMSPNTTTTTTTTILAIKKSDIHSNAPLEHYNT